MRTRQECGEVNASTDGFAGKGNVVGAVRRVAGQVSGEQSFASSTGHWRGGRIQFGDQTGGAAQYFFGEDDTGARTGPSCAAGAGLSGVYDFEGTPLPLGTLATVD